MAKGKFNFIAPVKPVNLETDSKVSPTADIAPLPSKIEGEDNYLKTRLIPRNKIKGNPKNKYEMTDIESLADSILHYGLLQPLVVVYLMEDDIYMLETGHRRVAALNKLIDTYCDKQEDQSPDYLLYKKYVKGFEKGFPCIVVAKINDGINYAEEDLANTEPDVIKSEIRLHLTNCEVRDIDRARTIARLSQLYDALNNGKRKGEKININKQIATDMQITERQVINYKNVSKLIPELQEAFEKKKITLKESSRIAQLDEEEQLTILHLLGEDGDKAKINALLSEKASLNNAMKELQKDLKEKENQLNNLHTETAKLKEKMQKASEMSPAPDPKLIEKNEEIKQRDSEIKELKQKIAELEAKKIDPEAVPSSASVNTEEMKMAITLKNALAETKRRMQELLETINNYKKYKNSSIITIDELNKELDSIQLMINVARN